MTTFNTGNPLGSTDVYDRYDNSENLDNFSNGPLDSYPDRFGVSRQSLQGIRNASQYVDLGPYAAGLVFTSRNQVFSYIGEFYAPGPAITLPYTTTGAGAGEIANFRSVGDAVLRQDLGEDADPSRGASLVGGLIANSLTLSVPSDHPTLNAAMDYLRGYTIARGATVTVQVSDGTHVITNGINFNHPQGSRLRILGNEATPANCIISCTSGAALDAFAVTNGNVLGYVNGFTISRPAPGPSGSGILALNGATITTGSSIVIQNWYYGIAARNGSNVYCPGAQVYAAGDVGIWAFNGSFVSCPGAIANDASDVPNNLGFGIQAEYGSSVECGGSSTSGNRIAGIAALLGGTVRAHSCIASNNIGSGFLVRDHSIIAVNASTANNNGRWGLERFGNGTSSGTYGGAGNSLGLQKPVAFLDNDVSNAALLSNTGAELVVGSNGPEGVSVKVQGSTAFRAGSLGTAAVNYAQCDASLTGTAVAFKARGADTNIDLQLSAKGTGLIWTGPFTASADAAITGYITVKDSAGVTRKLAVIS